MYGTQEVVAEKERLGPIEVVHFEGTIPEVHRQLGETVKEQVHRTVERKASGYESYEKFAEDLGFMRECLDVLKAKVTDESIDGQIRGAVSEYVASLQAWSEGAQLQSVADQNVERFVTENPDADEVLAYWLQNDNVGCQSGMYRTDEGILLWHTEEDVEDEPGSRFDTPRLAHFTFTADGVAEDRYSFVYPDLLPGPAAGFGENFFYAIDAQYYLPNEEVSILANTGAWIAWRLGEKADAAEIMTALSPFYDGYTLHAVRRTPDGRIEAQKIEFAHEFMSVYPLSEKLGSDLISVNITEPDSATKDVLEEFEDDEFNWFQNRVDRTRRALRLIEQTEEGVNVENLRRMLAFRIGNPALKDSEDGKKEFAGFANPDVKAHFAASFTPEKLVIAFSGGPALKDEEVSYLEI